MSKISFTKLLAFVKEVQNDRLYIAVTIERSKDSTRAYALVAAKSKNGEEYLQWNEANDNSYSDLYTIYANEEHHLRPGESGSILYGDSYIIRCLKIVVVDMLSHVIKDVED